MCLKRVLIIGLMLVSANLLAQTNLGPIMNTTQDNIGQASAPPNPTIGNCRAYFNTASGQMTYINSSGASCGGGGGGGSGTVNSGTINCSTYYAATGTTVSGQCALTWAGSNAGFSANVAATGSVSATSDGVHAGSIQLSGNTTAPAISANTAGWIAPASASFTAYGLQLPSANPSGGQLLSCATPSSSISACSWVSAGGGAVSGSGTTNTIPLWTGSTTLGNSVLTQSSGNLFAANQFGTGGNVQFGGIFTQYGPYGTLFDNGVAPIVGKTGPGTANGNFPMSSIQNFSQIGLYRISCYLVITVAATVSSTMPTCQTQWTDADTSVSETLVFSTQTGANNTVGTIMAGSAVINVKANTTILFGAQGYASSGATSMSYGIRASLEAIGN